MSQARSTVVFDEETGEGSRLIDLTATGAREGSGFVELLQALPRSLPIPQPIPIPLPIPFFFGARFLIWKQDPTVGDPGIRTVFVDGLILNGPLDARVATSLAGTTPVARNTSADFVFPPGTQAFDCAHSWAIVRETLTMYERLRGGVPIPWAWNTGGNTDVITVFPRAGVTANAYYSRSAKALKFFYFTPTGSPPPLAVYTCRSLDIVAHETGHAVLDGLKPGWIGASSAPQTGGLHEAFGDLSAIFLALSQLDQVEDVIALSKANLHSKNFIAALAEQFGAALGMSTGLRNADNDLKLSQVGNEVHAISQVFTGGMYDVMADIFAFEWARQRRVKDPALVLLEVAHRLCHLLLQAIDRAPASNATFADVVNQMLACSAAQGDPAIYRSFLRSRFTLREVVVSPTPLTALAEGSVDFTDQDFTEGEDLLELDATDIPATIDAPQDRSRCCGTMQLPEFTTVEQKVIESAAQMSDADLLGRETAELMIGLK